MVADGLYIDLRSLDNQIISLKSDADAPLTIKNANIIRSGSGDDVITGGGKYDGKLTQIYAGL